MECILVVDDHRAPCEVISILLRRYGYRVLTANSGEQAKQIALEGTSIDLLLTDVEMPVMSGDELAQWFRFTWPKTAIVFMSGNPMQQSRLQPCYFVEKPINNLNTFLMTIRTAISEHRVN